MNFHRSEFIVQQGGFVVLQREVNGLALGGSARDDERRDFLVFPQAQSHA
jgi:hypothetical protein